MSVYLLRHGQTDWNAKGQIQGRYDTELNELGISQAKAAGEKLRTIDFSHCYCSPLKRARQTAELALLGKDVPILYDDRLVEMAYGIYEGTNWREGDYQTLRRRLANRYPGGESYMDVAHRVYPLLDELREEGTRHDILLVTHGGVARVIRSYFEDAIDNDDFIDKLCPNGGILRFDYKERRIPMMMTLVEERS